MNSILTAYVGNEVLSLGQNPLIPVIPSPEEKNYKVWIIVLSVIGALLIGALGFVIYRWKAA